MRPKLLRSFIVVIAFWFIATTLYWSFQQPSENLKALQALKSLVPFLSVEVPTGNASIWQSLGVQLKVLWFWSMPMFLLAALSGALGYGAIWLKAKGTAKERVERETGHGTFRGVTLTLGVLPEPEVLPKEDLDLSAADNELLRKLTDAELAVLVDILGTIAAAPDAYPGEGITVTLLEHSLGLVETALNRKKHPGLAALVAAGHELAKLTLFSKDSSGRWVMKRGKDYERESSRILAAMDSWFKMPRLERDAVLMAIKFNKKPRHIPDLNGDPRVYQLARDILYEADATQTAVVAEQKQRTLETIEVAQQQETGQSVQDILFDAFLRGLPSLSFQNRGLPKGVQAVAWKVGGRVYLLEIKLRETVMAKLPDDVRGALTPNPKERQRVQPFTAELLKALEAKGWLVRSINGINLDVKDALWNIKAGKLDFKGVIVIDVPNEFKTQLPSDDSMYEIAVTGSLFNAGGHGQNSGGATPAAQAGSSISREDLLGTVLRPSSGNSKGDSSV